MNPHTSNLHPQPDSRILQQLQRQRQQPVDGVDQRSAAQLLYSQSVVVERTLKPYSNVTLRAIVSYFTQIVGLGWSTCMCLCSSVCLSVCVPLRSAGQLSRRHYYHR